MLLGFGQLEEARNDFERATEPGASTPYQFAHLAYVQQNHRKIDEKLQELRDQSEAAYFSYRARSAFLKGDKILVQESLDMLDNSAYTSHLEKSHMACVRIKGGAVFELCVEQMSDSIRHITANIKIPVFHR